jgi:beta-phosphoglucomutase-like phosphatase (HAD superfamily)
MDIPSNHLITMPLLSTPGGLIFDCDGTLADTMPLHYLAWREILDAYTTPGLYFPETQFYDWGGVSAKEILERLNAAHGLTLDVATITHEKEMSYRKRIPTLTGIAPVLAEVTRFHGVIPMAVVSGGMRELVEESLDVLGIKEKFVAIIGSEDVARSKPDPEGMLKAAQIMGVAPEQCVVYEDAAMGIWAAHRAGMRCVNVLDRTFA